MTFLLFKCHGSTDNSNDFYMIKENDFYMIKENSVIKIQNLMNHESRPVKSNPVIINSQSNYFHKFISVHAILNFTSNVAGFWRKSAEKWICN